MKRTLVFQVPGFIAIRIILSTMVRLVYPFLPIFGRGLGMDLQSLAYALSLRATSGVFGPFLASLADTRGRKVGMLLGLGLFIAGAGLMIVLPSFPTFAVTLVLTMIGNLVFIPSMQAYLSDKVSYRQRGLVLSLTELGWSLSFIIGVPIIGLIIAYGGWQAPFPFLAGFAVLAAILLAMLLPKDKPLSGKKPGVWQNLRTVFTYPPALAGMMIGFNLSGSNELVNLVFGVWLEDAFAVKIAALAAASAVIGFSELGGEILSAGLTDKLGKERTVAIGLALNILAAFCLPLLGRSLSGALVGLFFLYITFEFTMVGSIPLMSEIMPSARATMMAVYTASSSLGRAFGALAAPPLYRFGKALENTSSLLIIVPTTVVMLLIALFALRWLKSRRSSLVSRSGELG